LLNIGGIAAASTRIVAISWGIEDLSAAMGLPRVRDETGRYLDIPRYARVMCAVAASAAGVEAMDTVYTDIPDLDGLRRECRDGVAMGFSGKISIHPSQIEIINQEFTPSKAEGEDALALIAAFEEHAKKGAGAFTWKGQMMDQPHLTRAKKIADRARRAGVI
jgi:citrate lyase subunit beta/citryl-CoA lyase